MRTSCQALEVAQAKEFVDKKEGGLDFEIEQAVRIFPEDRDSE